MKVIINKDYIKKDCPKCYSTLGIHMEDIQVMDTQSDFVNCGVCGAAIEIPSSEIPQRWKSKLYPNT